MIYSKFDVFLVNFILIVTHTHTYTLTLVSAADDMIEVLIKLGEVYDAERYARICYECLTRPVDTESKEVGE